MIGSKKRPVHGEKSNNAIQLRNLEKVRRLLTYATARDEMQLIDQFLVKAKLEMPPTVTGPLEIMLRHASETPQDRSLALECLYKVKHYEQLIQILIKLQYCILNRRLADNGRKTIGIYFPSKAYREHTGTITQRLREKGHQVIILVGEVCRDKYEAEPEVYYGGHNAIKDMNFLDAVICPTLTDGLPKNAKQILMVHLKQTCQIFMII